MLNNRICLVLCCLNAAFLMPAHSLAAYLYVGPGMPLSRPSDAARVAEDGDVVEIEVGEYPGDVAVWTQNNLHIKGIGGHPRLIADGAAAEGKAIWVIKGDNTTVERIRFEEAQVPEGNAAGIRQEGANLTVRNCQFVNNQNGILTGHNDDSEILVEYSEFAGNGSGDGLTHNMYIGRVKKFTLRYSYSHHANVGHQVKSRARSNYILFNRLMDEANGNSSYLVDIANGGSAFLIGNLLHQGINAENSAMVSYASENTANKGHSLQVMNNTFVNEYGKGKFIVNRDARTEALVVNNILAGEGKPLQGRGHLQANLIGEAPRLRQPHMYDYRLTADSPAVNKGVEVRFAVPLDAEYEHVAGKAQRPLNGPIDIGAYEYR